MEKYKNILADRIQDDVNELLSRIEELEEQVEYYKLKYEDLKDEYFEYRENSKPNKAYFIGDYQE